MKNYCFLSIIFIFIILFVSCKDTGNNPSTDYTQYKVKMTIYVADLTKDSNHYQKYSDFYFDGDVQGFPKRTFFNADGSKNYRNELQQGRANVPLAINNYGCCLKEIEYTTDTSYFFIITDEYDNEGYLCKSNFDSYSNLNNSSYTTIQRDGDKIQKAYHYSENINDHIFYYFYNSKALIERTMDTNVVKHSVWCNYYHYNNLNQCDYIIGGDTATDGAITLYYYDNNGYKTQWIHYSKAKGDTCCTTINNFILYKGYSMNPDDVNNYEFDSNNNIIGYINKTYNQKYKIEYEFK